MTVSLRDVDRRDAPALASLLGQLGYPTTVDEANERLGYWLSDPAGFLIGAEQQGVLVGVVAGHICPILEVTGRFARLVALVVDERVRRQGVGQALVAEAERIAAERGCILVEVTSSRTRAGAHEFCRALGYRTSAIARHGSPSDSQEVQLANLSRRAGARRLDRKEKNSATAAT